jgi:hypothetical protein
MRPDLETLQQTFASALLYADHAEPALAMFKGTPDLNRKRIVFYQNNVFGNWQETLANVYPVLQQLVGEDFFNDLAHTYGLTHASQSGDLAEFGASFSSYIRALENCRDYPYFGDVAALEWLVYRSYYSKQSKPVTLAQLAAFPPEQLPELHVKFQATCALFQSPWAVAEIWHAHQGTDTPLPKQVVNTNHCLVWRPYGLTKWKVQVSLISAASYKALQALAAGESLGQALELALEENPEFAVQTDTHDWFNKQLFSEIIQEK